MGPFAHRVGEPGTTLVQSWFLYTFLHVLHVVLSAALISVLCSPQPDTSRRRETTVTELVNRVVCPFTPQISLVLINRPWRDGTLSWHWYTTTHQPPAPYHMATAYLQRQWFNCCNKNVHQIPMKRAIKSFKLACSHRYLWPLTMTLSYDTIISSLRSFTTSIKDVNFCQFLISQN